VSAGFEGRGEVVQRRASLLAGAAAFVAIGLVMMFFGAPAWGGFVELSLALALFVAFSADAYRVRRGGVVRADASGVYLDEHLLATGRDIASAYVLGTGEPVVHVVLRQPGRRFDLQLDSEASAQALPRALGFDTASSVATFSGYYGGRWANAMSVLAINLAANVGIQAVVAPMRGRGVALFAMSVTLLAALGVLLGLRRVHIDVGTDGILLRRIGRRTFVPYRSLAGATAAGSYVVLNMRSGKDVRLGMGTSLRQAQSREALVQRIEQALAAYDGGRDDAHAEAIVAPGGRPLPVWLSEVRSLARAHDYREATVDSERLWRVVRDPKADPAARAGAAVALSGTADDETRVRLRVASNACAEPKLRVALARVADGADEALLEEALAPLADADAARNAPIR
jgi:hypothetical protein